MQQPPPGYGQFQPPYPPSRPNAIVKPLLIGCGSLLVLLIVAGGVATWFAVHAVHAALGPNERVVSVARNAIASAQQAEADAKVPAGASPDPAQGAAAGVAMLKSFVTGGKSHVETLPRAALKAVLPASVDALARSNSESSRTSVSGISGTSVSASYGGTGGRSAVIEVTDAANMTGLTTVMDFAMGAVATEDDEGYERSVQLGDVRVHERWVASAKRAELLGLVADRFVVSVDSDGIGMASTERAFESMDVAKLLHMAATPQR